jgi:hypothetical protein
MTRQAKTKVLSRLIVTGASSLREPRTWQARTINPVEQQLMVLGGNAGMFDSLGNVAKALLVALERKASSPSEPGRTMRLSARHAKDAMSNRRCSTISPSFGKLNPADAEAGSSGACRREPRPDRHYPSASRLRKEPGRHPWDYFRGGGSFNCAANRCSRTLLRGAIPRGQTQKRTGAAAGRFSGHCEN